jgi:hypothetical protein
VPVGKEWSAQVTRAGRRPEDYAEAYAELAELIDTFGFDLEEMDGKEITCISVQTTEGPGFTVSLRHRMEDGPPEMAPAT